MRVNIVNTVCVPNASPTELVPYNASRRAFSLYNQSATDSIWIGRKKVTHRTGLEVKPEMYFSPIDPEPALYCYQKSGATLDVSVIETIEE